MWGYFEKRAFRKALGITTVNLSLNQWFYDSYKRQSHILLNIPLHWPDMGKIADRQIFELPSEAFVWVYQGIIQKGRGVDGLLKWIATRPDNEFLLLIGPVSRELQTQLQLESAHSKIRLAGAFSQKELLSVTAIGNAGLMLIDTTTTSYRLSLPNKFFEYLAAGLPVISSALPEVKRYMDNWQCGLMVESSDQLTVAADQLIGSYQQYRKAVIECQKDINTEEVQKNLSQWICQIMTSGT